MKYAIPFPRLDKEREKAFRFKSDVITYQASPELRAELTERMEKKAADERARSERDIINTNSKSKRR